MILDYYLTFTGTSPSQPTFSPTTGTQAAQNIIDLGLLGIPTSTNGGGARDIGVGDDPAMKLSALIATTFLSGTSLQLQLQGAPDDGTGNPGTYTTMWTSNAVVEASLTAGTQMCNIDMPRPVPGQPLPRFLKLNFITVGTHTAGSIEAQIVLDRDDQIVGTTGLYSGYPAGITVAN